MRLIRYDRFDDGLWGDALAESPSLKALWERGSARSPIFQDLLADTFQALQQPFPKWIELTRPTLHEHLLRELFNTREFQDLKVLAENDPVNATLATDVLGRRCLESLAPEVDQRMADETRLLEELQAAQAEAAELLESLAEADETGNPEPAGLKGALSSVQSRIAHAQAALASMPSPTTYDGEVGRLRREYRQAAASAQDAIGKLKEADEVLGGAGGSLELKLRLAERLERSPKLAKLVEMAGRMRRIALQKRASVIQEARADVIGLTTGQDLSRVVPSELVHLGSTATRLLFLKRFVEGELLLYEHEGEEQLGGGPIVICLDGSGSMDGDKELWSKAVLLGYLAIAERERRDILVCQFGGTGELVTFAFPYRTSPTDISREDILMATETFLASGSTDLECPLRWAAAQIGSQMGPLKKADVALLTDAEASLSEGFLDWWKQEKARLGFQAVGVLIGSTTMAEVLAAVVDELVMMQDLASDGEAVSALFGR
jgi:uncharacterized protein with von Willebrand factor type A (vWA) domain